MTLSLLALAISRRPDGSLDLVASRLTRDAWQQSDARHVDDLAAACSALTEAVTATFDPPPIADEAARIIEGER